MKNKPEKPAKGTTEQRLRLAIQAELKKCDGVAYPHVCQLIQTREGYQKAESLIIHTIINQSLSVGPAIALVETELS